MSQLAVCNGLNVLIHPAPVSTTNRVEESVRLYWGLLNHLQRRSVSSILSDSITLLECNGFLLLRNVAYLVIMVNFLEAQCCFFLCDNGHTVTVTCFISSAFASELLGNSGEIYYMRIHVFIRIQLLTTHQSVSRPERVKSHVTKVLLKVFVKSFVYYVFSIHSLLLIKRTILIFSYIDKCTCVWY